MTVDIRGKVFCNLGTVIQASIADEAITAQQGLIRCRGQVVLQGLVTPSVGSFVYFGWERDGILARVPRTLRVLSSFANPLTRETTVQLGDKLIYLQNLKGQRADPNNEEENPETPDQDQPRPDPFPPLDEENQCLNLQGRLDALLFRSREQADRLSVLESYLGAPASILRRVPLTIRASDVLKKCLAALNISKTGTELIAQFTDEEFDLSGGYVNVIDQLLANESLYGYLNENEVLVVNEIINPTGSGPLLNENTIIELEGLNQGLLPGQLVTVKLENRTLTPADPLEPEPGAQEEEEADPIQADPIQNERPPSDENKDFYQNNWEYEESVVTGLKAIFNAREPVALEFEYPYSVTTEVYTTYDDDDYVIKRVTLRKTIGAEAIGSLIAQQILGEFGRFVIVAPGDTFSVSAETNGFAQREFVTRTVEEFEYEVLDKPEDPSNEDLFCPDPEAEPRVADQTPPKVEKVPTKQTVTTYEESLAVLAKINLSGFNWRVFRLSNIPVLSPSIDGFGDAVITDKTIITYSQNEPTGQTKTRTDRYTLYCQTQEGQQESAYRGRFTSTVDRLTRNFATATRLTFDQSEVSIRRDRTFGVQKRPSANELLEQSFGERGPAGSERDEEEGTIEVTIEEETNTIEVQPNLPLELPLGSDDGFVWTASNGFEFSGSNAATLAARYARAQNAILRGNRSGVALQIPVYAMPLYPFSYVFIQAAGVTGGYRSNGMSWAINSEGILCSMDALFWGGVGGSGTAWFPVAPGITSLPADPTVTFGTPAPANSLEAPEGFDATDPEGIWSLLPVGQAPTYEESIAPTNLVPVVNERVRLTAASRAVISVRSVDYSLTLPTETVAVVSRAVIQVVTRLLASAGSVIATGQPAALKYTRRIKAGAGAFVRTGFGAGSIRDYRIGTNFGTVVLTGGSAKLKYQRKALTAEPTALVVTGQAAQFLKGISLKADGSAFVSTGFAAALTAARRLVGIAGSFSLTGQDAGGGIVQPSDQFFSSVQLLLKGEGTNGGSTITDSSSNNRSVATNSGAVTSTAQFKYGTSSLYFDATTTTTQKGFTYTVSSGSTFGTGDYTIELFVRFSALSRVYRIFAIDSGTGVLTTDTSNNIRWLGSVFTPSPALAANTWYHLAAVRSSSSVKVYLDGTQIGSAVTSTANHTGTTWWVGRDFDTDTGLYGYIDELRITKGVARYTANFTPPTKTFPVQ